MMAERCHMVLRTNLITNLHCNHCGDRQCFVHTSGKETTARHCHDNSNCPQGLCPHWWSDACHRSYVIQLQMKLLLNQSVYSYDHIKTLHHHLAPFASSMACRSYRLCKRL